MFVATVGLIGPVVVWAVGGTCIWMGGAMYKTGVETGNGCVGW